MTLSVEAAKRAVAKYGSVRAASKELGIARTTIRRLLERPDGAVAVTRDEQAAPIAAKRPAASIDVVGSTSKVRPVSAFREMYDDDTIVPARVTAALKTLGMGWVYEAEFIRMAGVSPIKFGHYRDQFADFCVALPDNRRAWAGRKQVAAELRSML